MPKFKRYFTIVGALCCAGIGIILYQTLPTSLNVAEGTPTNSPAQLQGRHNITHSPYYAAPDVYNMRSGGSLTVLSKFKTRQQETGYTCGPAAAAMVAEYFPGTPKHTEAEIAKIMGTNRVNGTNVKGMSKYFESMGWQVKNSLTDKSPSNYKEFLLFVKANLLAGIPIIVENVEIGGHWRVIIGYDNMGTEYEDDDVLLMADPYDTTDHIQDGYAVNSAMKFFYMWFDAQLFNSSERKKPWLTACPR